MKLGKSTSLALWQVGLIVYGGTDMKMGLVMKSVFYAGFLTYASRNAWDKVGAAPLTMAA